MKVQKYFLNLGAQGVFDKKNMKNLTCYRLKRQCLSILKRFNLQRKNNISKDRIMLDPGIGLDLLKEKISFLINKIDMIKERGYFTFLGVSRKKIYNQYLK